MMYPQQNNNTLSVTHSHTRTHTHARSAEMKTKINLKINTSVKSGKTLFRARTHTRSLTNCSSFCFVATDVFSYTYIKKSTNHTKPYV